jgi:hypothetical protein
MTDRPGQIKIVGGGSKSQVALQLTLEKFRPASKVAGYATETIAR